VIEMALGSKGRKALERARKKADLIEGKKALGPLSVEALKKAKRPFQELKLQKKPPQPRPSPEEIKRMQEEKRFNEAWKILKSLQKGAERFSKEEEGDIIERMHKKTGLSRRYLRLLVTLNPELFTERKVKKAIKPFPIKESELAKMDAEEVKTFLRRRNAVFDERGFPIMKRINGRLCVLVKGKKKTYWRPFE